ncbi:hypothetical protein CEXT_507891 [Caerostris extrusa]|uniref:Uncharacterized protein n=1 Tax=Caerostris extrusa TaxID=172846 RepID=A0AAV4XBA8_CAEEX|nr:hypothetical protein CEXT_507891 [Caerostris extrusa]
MWNSGSAASCNRARLYGWQTMASCFLTSDRCGPVWGVFQDECCLVVEGSTASCNRARLYGWETMASCCLTSDRGRVWGVFQDVCCLVVGGSFGSAPRMSGHESSCCVIHYSVPLIGQERPPGISEGRSMTGHPTESDGYPN